MVLDKPEPRVNTDTPPEPTGAHRFESVPEDEPRMASRTDRPIARARTEMSSLQSGPERQHDDVELLDDDLVVEDEGISLASLTSAIAPRRTLRKPPKVVESVRPTRSAPVPVPSSPPTVPRGVDSPATWEDQSFTNQVANVPPPPRVPASTWDDASLTNQVVPSRPRADSSRPRAGTLPSSTPGSGPRAVPGAITPTGPGSRLPTVNPPRFTRSANARSAPPTSEPLADLWDEPPVDRRQERTQPLVAALAPVDPDAAETEVFSRGSAPQLAQFAMGKKASAPIGIPPYFVAGGQSQAQIPGVRAPAARSSATSNVAPLATHVRPQEPTVIVLRDNKSRLTWALASAGLGAFAAVVAMLAVGPGAPPSPAPVEALPPPTQAPAPVTLGAVAPRPSSVESGIVTAPTNVVTTPLVASPSEMATTPAVSLPPTSAQEPRTVSFAEGEGVAIASPASQVPIPLASATSAAAAPVTAAPAPKAPLPQVARAPQPAVTAPSAEPRPAPAARPESKPVAAPPTTPAPAGRRLTPEQELAEAQLKASMR